MFEKYEQVFVRIRYLSKFKKIIDSDYYNDKYINFKIKCCDDLPLEENIGNVWASDTS